MNEDTEPSNEPNTEPTNSPVKASKFKGKDWKSISERRKSIPFCITVMPSGKNCKLPAVRGFTHCQNHLTNEERTKRELGQRGRAITSDEASNIEKESLVSELALLKACLSKASKNLVKGDKIDPDEGKQVMALIEGIRKLAESLKKIETQDKVWSVVNKISKVLSTRCIETINKFVSDADTRSLIAAELLRVAKVEESSGDLKDLLKDVTTR